MMRKSTDVVIVGGGIVGMTTAYLLGKRGIKSVVIEKDSIGSHASGFAYGGLGADRTTGPMALVAQEGWRLHNEFPSSLLEETGIDIQFRFRPSLTLSFTEDEAMNLKNGSTLTQEERGDSSLWLSREETLRIEPRVSKDILGALYNPNGADLEPYRLMVGLTQAAEKLGATIRHGQVIGLKGNHGVIESVILENEELVTERVVLAMGPWSSSSSDWLGVNLAVSPLKGQILRLEAPGAPIKISVGWAGNYAITKPDGLLWTGTTEEHAEFDEGITLEARDQITKSLIKMLPSMVDARLAQQTACLRPLSADGLLILGMVPEWDGVYIATGAGRQGIALGPGMASIVADLIDIGSTNIPITAFNPLRFSN
jgi:glycine oxidase